MKEDHWVLKNLDYYVNYFHPGGFDVFIKVDFLFGIEGTDRSHVSYWEAADPGKPIYNQNFDPSSEEAQNAMYEICLKLNSNDLVLLLQTRCMMARFRAFMLSTQVPKASRQFPCKPSEFNKWI